MMPIFCFLGSLEQQFPLGIDSERFVRAIDLPPVQEHMKVLKQRFAGRKVRATCSI